MSGQAGFDSRDPRFDTYVLGNAPLEQLGGGYRWIEGPVWMADWNCLLFQDLPRNRTMRWSEADGFSVWREPSNYGNGQTRDRQGRLITCSHRGRCLYRTEWDGSVTTLVTHHDGKRLNGAERRRGEIGRHHLVSPTRSTASSTTTRAAGSIASNRRRCIGSIPTPATSG